MSEIEKMYKSIFGEFAPNCSLCVKLVDCKIFNNTRNCNKFECDYKKLFTSEKQLELIKGLGTTEYYTFGIFYRQGLWYIFTETTNRHNENFEESLAGLINSLWQDLTEEERKQIKEILE